MTAMLMAVPILYFMVGILMGYILYHMRCQVNPFINKVEYVVLVGMAWPIIVLTCMLNYPIVYKIIKKVDSSLDAISKPIANKTKRSK